jgi:S-adenosylmethionine decarboxylase
MPRVNYCHVTVECSGCPANVLNSNRDIRAVLRSAARSCNLNIVKEDIYHFRPQGVTAYVLLSESHISIHTWPEKQFALVDILSCSSLDVETLVKSLRELLRPSSTNISCNTRSSRRNKIPK